MVEQELKLRTDPANYDSFEEWAKTNIWLIILLPVYIAFRPVIVILKQSAKLVGFNYKAMKIYTCWVSISQIMENVKVMLELRKRIMIIVAVVASTIMVTLIGIIGRIMRILCL